MNTPTLKQLSDDLAAGHTCSRELVEKAYANIADREPEGGPVFLHLDQSRALVRADELDRLRKAGREPSPFAGIPFSVKDLFDIAGQVTTAGSVILKGTSPAECTAPAIGRLMSAGFVMLGRTNMTEFAYSGVGLNPHYGTPRSIWDRQKGRIPGGSSSGAAVSVADGTCGLAIGTDTGGSCRIPAAFNGLVGYKSSLGRVPTQGVFPLATSFDTVGPLVRTVQCAAFADAIMAGDWDGQILPRPLKGMRLGMPLSLVLDDLDGEVATVFDLALKKLAGHGVEIVDVEFPELAQLPEINAGGGIAAAEAYGVHARNLTRQGEGFDQRVRKRILAGAEISDESLTELKEKRAAMILRADEIMSDVDAFVMPTTPHVAAAISDLDDDADYGRINLLALRNTFVGNFLNRCAITIPAHSQSQVPVGLMLMAPLMSDRALFGVALAIEAIVSPVTG